MARSGLVMLAGIAVGVLAASGLAQNQVRMEDPGSSWRHGSFAGGAFRAVTVSGYIGEGGGPGGSANSFLTFCLERGENIGLPQTSYADIGMRAMNGGPDGGNDPAPGDPLSSVTAYLYWIFRTGQSMGSGAFAGAVDNADDTRSLQRAIWFSENEFTGSESEWQNDSRAQNYYNWAVANSDGDFHGVAIMRVWANYNNGEYSGNRQDQLTLIPLPPAAWAGLGSLAGVMAIGYVRRRKQLS